MLSFLSDKGIEEKIKAERLQGVMWSYLREDFSKQDLETRLLILEEERRSQGNRGLYIQSMLYHLSEMNDIFIELKNGDEEKKLKKEFIEKKIKKHFEEVCKDNSPETAMLWYAQYYNWDGQYDLSSYYMTRAHYPYRVDRYASGPFFYSRTLVPSYIIQESKDRYQKNPYGFVQEIKPASAQADCVYFFGCDSVYFMRYANNLIFSVLENSHNVIHAHLIDPTAEAIECLKDIIKKSPAGKVGYSIEKTGHIADKRAYYAISRFIMLPEVLRVYQKNVFLIDVDMQLKCKDCEFFSSLEGVDLGLMQPGKGIAFLFDWFATHAGLGYYSFSKKGIKFAELVRGVLLLSFNPIQKNNWGVDQIALSRCIAEMDKEQERSQNVIFNLDTLQTPFSVPRHLKSQ